MQRVSSSLSNGSRATSRSPSVALAGRSQVATLPVQLLRDNPAAVQDHGRAEDNFQMKMDAQGFAPEELVVQVTGQNLMVTGQRQREYGNPAMGGYRMEQKVQRQMQLPRDLDPAAMTCCLTPSGQLWVRGQCGSLPPLDTQAGPSPPRLRGHSPKKGPNLA
ncbi:heat shock protein beta-9 [Ochotona curzoniae]|uniref:heat shock protein beta-9-like n=1 Tax=Ochotona curzoniae TaxID=130825 RepID=UPI001B34E4A5|nr:heat shock protein beta-9-like [Ochotona curzoniae]XP_040857424.1 heat shock protein beta-9 [Ochotona curzoniae]